MPRNIPDAKLAEVDQYLELECKNYQIPGLSAVIVDAEEILWMKAWGFANLELKIPATVDTRYRICSVTKLFTATMLMQLCEQNRLHLDESVEKYIPELSQLHQSVPMTFRHLVSHTSGLPIMPPNIQKFVPKPIHEFTHEDYCKLLYPMITDVIADLNETKLLCQPGDQIHYSNFGIALMAFALEKIARQDYQTYIIEQILQPLAMHDATFDVYGGMSNDVALGYYAWDGKKQQALPYHYMGAFTPTGGLYSSARDMAQFLILHLGKVQNEKSAVLTQQSIQQMRQPILKTEKSRYVNGAVNGGVGIGWFLSSIANTPVVEHGGGDFPFTTFFLLAPALNLGIFLATNTGSYPEVVARMAYKLVDLLVPNQRP